MNINEIAKLAGVSRATVSRYLNNGYVSADKKISIQKVIDETGYQPSVSAKSLRSKKSHSIGVIIPKINSDSISRMVAGISTILSNNGYQLLLACTDNHEEKELEYLSLFRENHVDGIILLGTIFTKEHKTALAQLSVPIVILGQNISDYSCVYHDDYEASKAITSSIIKAGTYFGFLGANPLDIAVGKNRLEGFLDAMKEADIPDTHYHIETCTFNKNAGYLHAKELLSAHPEIDSIVCATDTFAIGAMMYLREVGKKIPNDIQIVGLNDSTVSHVTTPMLSTVHFYFEEAGKEAANCLLDMIGQKKDEPKMTKSLKLGYQVMMLGSSR